MYKTFLLASALAGALIFAQPAAAQHGHGGPGHGHGGHGGHYGGHGGHYGGHFGHYGHGLVDHFLGHHQHGYYYPSYGYGSYYASPNYSYSSPGYYNYPSTNYQYYPPTSGAPIVQPQVSSDQAQIQVVLPNPDAEVTFDGAKTTSVGRVRLFHTSSLDPNGSYSYRIGASWMQDGRPITDARVVSVAPGRTVVVDFTQPVTESVPLPKGK